MKPKYYSCLFLSLFACDQGNIQDTNRKDNLLDGPASTELINNFCKEVKDTYDKNDPSARVELTTKLVGKYANSFCSLARCQGIFKQLCEQVPTYPSQIVYDVLYALLKNKWLDADGVRTIIQGIKEDNPNVFSLLNNYVCLNRSRVNETDDSARIIAESFGFIFNDIIFIPGINIFTSTPLPSPETKINVDNLTDIWKCVRFIICNGFDKTSLQQLIKLASSGDFNEAIKAIADAKIFFKGSGDEMMEVFQKKKVNLNDEGLQALANCIDSGKKIATTQNVKYLIPYLNNCTDLAPIFNKCTNDVTFDDFITLLDLIDLNRSTLLDPLAKSLKNETFNLDCLKQLIATYNESDTFNKVLSKISQDKFTKNEKGDDVIQAFEKKNIKLDDDNLAKILSMIDNTKQILKCQKAIDFCYNNIENLKEKNIPAVFYKVEEKFHRNDLKTLLNNVDVLNAILPYIPEGKLSSRSTGQNIIQIIENNLDSLNANTIHTVLSMISNNYKITDTKYFTKIFQWCCGKTDLNINNFIPKCENFQFGLSGLQLYQPDYHNQFFAVLNTIPSQNLHTHRPKTILGTIHNRNMKFDKGDLSIVLRLCNNSSKAIAVNDLYYVFSRSYTRNEDVDALIALVKNDSLNGNNFFLVIDDKAKEAEAPKDFITKFYSKIQDHTITISDENAEKFVWFAYIWYGQDKNLKDLQKKMDKQQQKKKKKMVSCINKALKKETLTKFGGNDKEYNDFDEFKEKLSKVLELNK